MTEAAQNLTDRLDNAYDRFFASLPENTYAKFDRKRWHLSVDSAEPLDPTEEIKLEQFKDWLKKRMRHIKLPQLLIEVDNDLHFTRHFLPPTQSQSRPADEIVSILAEVMAHGCNIGPDTMAQITPGISYWQLTNETQRAALADVVNAIARLDITSGRGGRKKQFILDYMSQPPLRRQIRRGLLKGDHLHSLARDVAFAKRGRITKRDFYELMKTCSCLTLILACIVYWQAKEIGRVIAECDPQKSGIDFSLLEHVSPAEWENVVLYGEYFIDRNLIR